MTTTSSYPLISVIMPVYNHEKYVTQALLSILNQTYPNIEIIIIDDGSKDASCAQIEVTIANWNQSEEINRKIQFIKQENRGAHETINRGLSLAKGEWLTILNSDDYYDLTRLEVLLQQVLAAKAQIAFTRVVGVDDKGSPLSPGHRWVSWYEHAQFQLFRFTTPTIGFCLLESNIAVSTGNLFFSSHLFNQVGPFKDLKLAHDIDFLLRALIFTEPLFIKENLYFYRVHGDNTATKIQHLTEIEWTEIYREYLCNISAKPPINRQAPCHWYWPSEFLKWRLKLNMDRGLDVYIEKINKPLFPFEKKQNLLSEKNKKLIPITLISHELSLTGAPKLVVDLAACLKSHGYAPKIIAILDGPMKQVLKNQGFSVHAIFDRSKFEKNLTYKLISPLLLMFALFRVKGKVISNSIMSGPIVFFLTLMRFWNKPIWYIHESFPPAAVTKGVVGKIVALLMSVAKKISPPRLWFGSEATRKAWKYSEFPNGQVMYWSGIPVQSIQHKEKKELKSLLSVGSASARKGTHTLIDAFLLCANENRIPKDVTLTIVGFPDRNSSHFPPLADTILKVVTSKHKDRIRMIGSVDPSQLDEFYQKADVFIQSSTMECMPIALLTAMSIALPIITTNVDGCVEAITDRENGYLCFPYNVNSLADAIAGAVNNPQRSIEMGVKAKETFDARFSLEATQDNILKEINLRSANVV